MSRGLDAFSATLAGSGSTSPTSLPPASGSDSSDSGGIGFGTILAVVAIAGGGFLLIRRMTRGRQERKRAEIDLAEDRAEIEEQLKNNADRVIALGDRVIAKGDHELIALYEEASAAYQDVSQRIDDAENAVEIDELDDRIDRAEWQFEVIEAELEGRPRPRPPAPDDVLTGNPDGGSVDDRAGHGAPSDGTRRPTSATTVAPGPTGRRHLPPDRPELPTFDRNTAAPWWWAWWSHRWRFGWHPRRHRARWRPRRRLTPGQAPLVKRRIRRWSRTGWQRRSRWRRVAPGWWIVLPVPSPIQPQQRRTLHRRRRPQSEPGRTPDLTVGADAIHQRVTPLDQDGEDG